jgi:hypothetical protein
MNILDALRGLVRRWYITVPGLLVAIATACGMWFAVAPDYERTATQILLPGMGTLPEDSTNPYLYLGGLTVVADVVVRTVGSEEALRDLYEQNPGVTVAITRDASTAGPVILVTVTAPTDARAGSILKGLITQTAVTLEELQAEAGIVPDNRVTVTSLAIDRIGIPQQRTRILISAAAGGGLVLLTLVAASIVDGLAASPRRRKEADAADSDDPDVRQEARAEGDEDADAGSEVGGPPVIEPVRAGGPAEPSSVGQEPPPSGADGDPDPAAPETPVAGTEEPESPPEPVTEAPDPAAEPPSIPSSDGEAPVSPPPRAPRKKRPTTPRRSAAEASARS